MAGRRARRCVCVCFVCVVRDRLQKPEEERFLVYAWKKILSQRRLLRAGLRQRSLHNINCIQHFDSKIRSWLWCKPTWMCSPECCGLRSSALSQNTQLSDGPGRPDAHRLPCTYTQTHRGRDIMDESALALSRTGLQEGRAL